MDHLPLPSSAIHPPPNIPLLQLDDYDGLGFLGYPERQGWLPRPVKEWRKLFQNPSQDFTAFMERWSLFGMMDCLFDKRIKTLDFVRHVGCSASPALSTERLMDLLKDFSDVYVSTGRESDSFRNTFVYVVRLHMYLSLASDAGSKDDQRTQDFSVSLFRYIDSGRVPRDPRSSGFAMVVAALLESLSLIASDGPTASRSLDERATAVGMNYSSLYVSLVWTQLRADGWCPSQLVRLWSRFNTNCLYYLHNCTRPRPHETHRMATGPTGGNEETSSTAFCTASKCVHRVLDNNTYQTAHASWCFQHEDAENHNLEDCNVCKLLDSDERASLRFDMERGDRSRDVALANLFTIYPPHDKCLKCRMVDAEPNTIYEYLERDNIPLIQSIDESEVSDGIALVEANQSTPYVAISHVWSDGLGNLQSNALPLCQLLRLSKMVQDLVRKEELELSPRPLFWLDTVCVPPDSTCAPLDPMKLNMMPESIGATERMKKAQSKALTLMRQTYESAAAVLVLDSWLFTSCSIHDSHLEILIKIFACDWQSRLWTFQEGALAKRLFFQLRNGAYNLDYGIQQLASSPDLVASVSMIPVLKGLNRFLRNFREERGVEDKLAAAVTGLAHRTTSMPSDEPLCLGILTDLDPKKIEDIVAETDLTRKKTKFWTSVDAVPAWLLFDNSRKLSIEGFRWAPETVLQSTTVKNEHRGLVQMSTLNFPAIPSNAGLLVQFSGIRFFTRRTTIGRHAFLRTGKDTWYRLTVGIQSAVGVERTPYRPSPHSQAVTYGINPWISCGSEEVAIIVKSIKGDLRNFFNGTLVAIRGEVYVSEHRDRVISCQLLCTIRGTMLTAEVEAGLINDLNITFRNRHYGGDPDIERNSRTLGGAVGKRTSNSQRWVVA